MRLIYGVLLTICERNIKGKKNGSDSRRSRFSSLWDSPGGDKMSKVVILSGSVRSGGNTELLVQSFATGARQNHDVEIISVADYKVNPCIGCNTCFQREGNGCFQQDDMQKIYPRLSEADIIVVASPVYFYGISAQLKAIVDRLHTPMRDTFRVKKLALLLVAAATLPEVFDSINIQYELILNYFHMEDAGKVLVRGVKDKGDIKGNPALEEAFRLGTKC